MDSKRTVRVNLRPHLEDLGVAYVHQVASQSRSGKKHYVLEIANEAPDGLPSLRCSCEGFQTSGHCWHVDKVREKRNG